MKRLGGDGRCERVVDKRKVLMMRECWSKDEVAQEMRHGNEISTRARCEQ